jgi:hypothetical protein
MKRQILCFFLYLLPILLFATPDKQFWVIDELVGFTNDSYILFQKTYDNLQSHYQFLAEEYIVKKNFRNGKVEAIKKVFSINYNNSTTIDTNLERDILANILNAQPDVFKYNYLAFPMQSLDETFHYSDSTKELTFIYSKKTDEKPKRINLIKYIPDEIKSYDIIRIVQVYSYDKYFFILTELRNNYYDQYQKIIVVPENDFM